MADFCKQCSVELFGVDNGDLVRDSSEVLKEDEGFPEICEGCGYIWVNHSGECIGPCKKHKPEKVLVIDV